MEEGGERRWLLVLMWRRGRDGEGRMKAVMVCVERRRRRRVVVVVVVGDEQRSFIVLCLCPVGVCVFL